MSAREPVRKHDVGAEGTPDRAQDDAGKQARRAPARDPSSRTNWSSEDVPPEQRQLARVRRNVQQYAHFKWPDVEADGDGGAKIDYQGPAGKFWTEVTHKQADGTEKQWDARRHRRNLLPRRQRDENGNYVKLDGHNPFRLHGKYIDADAEALSRLRRISFFVGPTFVVGSILFVLGAAAGEFPGSFNGNWSTTKTDWLINIPYLVGAVFYLWGAYCSALEAANVNYRNDVRDWTENKYDTKTRKSRSKPRIDYLPFPSHVRHDFISYYGAFVQYIGAWAYVAGTLAALLNTHLGFSDEETRIWVTSAYFVGGVGFVLGGYLMAAEACHSWWWAILPPPPSQATNIGRWAEYLNFLGSFLFFFGGVLGYYSNIGLVAWQWVNGFAFVVGSFVFLLQACLLTFEWFFPHL